MTPSKTARTIDEPPVSAMYRWLRDEVLARGRAVMVAPRGAPRWRARAEFLVTARTLGAFVADGLRGAP